VGKGKGTGPVFTDVSPGQGLQVLGKSLTRTWGIFFQEWGHLIEATRKIRVLNVPKGPFSNPANIWFLRAPVILNCAILGGKKGLKKLGDQAEPSVEDHHDKFPLVNRNFEKTILIIWKKEARFQGGPKLHF